jgi:hypothetical protein
MVAWVIISMVLLGMSIVIKSYLNSRSYNCAYGEPAGINLLGSINGIGSSFYGSSRGDGETEVRYIFICFIGMPILPIGCRRVSESGSSGMTPVFTESYKIYGRERWNLLEILQIYFLYWGGLSSIISVLALIISIASAPYSAN